jgi:hypothetical protein
VKPPENQPFVAVSNGKPVLAEVALASIAAKGSRAGPLSLTSASRIGDEGWPVAAFP